MQLCAANQAKTTRRATYDATILDAFRQPSSISVR